MNNNLTETINDSTTQIDTLNTEQVLTLINSEDQRVALAVQKEIPNIAKAVDAISEKMRNGGRLFYVGAGTSGRLGVLDASEMPPTFGVSPDVIIGIIAGGDHALRNPIEGAEDDPERGKLDLMSRNFTGADCVIGIAASGRTQYVIGALNYANALGAITISLCCNSPAPVHDAAKINIAPLVGAEVIAGSTRMKSGTAQKLVLNMISTGCMIKQVKTYGNLMVDLKASNVKLRDRAKRIVAQAAGVDLALAESLLQQANGEVKTAIVAHKLNIGADAARARLIQYDGSVRRAIES